MAAAEIDWQEVEHFLEAIGRASGPVVLSLFPARSDQPCLHFRSEADAIETAAISAALATRPSHSLGVVVNPPDPQPQDWGSKEAHYSHRRDGSRGRLRTWGAQACHISRAVALWCECDGGLPLEAQEAIPQMAGLPPPSLSIWSGGKSLHHYWVFTPGQEIDSASFRLQQRRLAQAFQQVAPDARPDPSLCNPNRVMRLPGVRHPATGDRARIHRWSRETYGAAELEEWLPPLSPSAGGSPPISSADAPTSRQGHAAPGGGRRSRWFASLPLERQRSLAVEMLSLLPPRQAPGSGTYPAAFATLAALVHHFGSDTAVAIAREADWQGEHWDPARKVQQIGPGRLQAAIGTLVGRAEDAGWRAGPDLPPLPDPTADLLRGFRFYTAPELSAIAATAATGASASSSTLSSPASPVAAQVLGRQDCRDRLQRAVEDDLGGSDLELLLDELSQSSDLSSFSLRALHNALRQEQAKREAIAHAAASLQAESRRQRQGGLTLEELFPPLLAYSLRTLTRHLPFSDPAVAIAFLAGLSGLTKLGTAVCGNPITHYVVPTNLYVAIVARSGQKKTALQRLAIEGPTEPLRGELQSLNRQREREWLAACQGARKDERPSRPTPLHLQVQDYTGEALTALLHTLELNSLGLLVLRDEIKGLFGSLNAYRSGRGADEQQLLELFDGSAYTSLRISTSTRSFHRCHVSIYGGVQPEVLRELVAGGDPSGKWARFLFCPLPERTQPLPTRIAEAERVAVRDAAEALQVIARSIYVTPPRTYTLEEEALLHFAHYEHGKQRQALDARISAQAAIHGKAAGKVLRVAGLLHLLRLQDDPEPIGSEAPIPLATLERAIALVESLDGWALGFHELVQGDGAEAPVSVLMRRLHAIALAQGAPITWRDVSRRLSSAQRQGVNVAVADAAMRALAESGYGEISRGPMGGLAYRATCALP